MPYIILFSSLVGLFVAYHIYSHKIKNKKLICPIKADCEGVIHSEYSKFLGVDLEKLGIFYYSLNFIFYLSYLISKTEIPILEFIFFKLSLLAFLFSIYLTLIQILKLRKYCSWCLISALCCLVIFIASYSLYRTNIVYIAQIFKDLSTFLHALSAGVGLGVVFVVDYLFFKFIKDKRIDEREKEVLDYLSDFVWLILGLILVSGFFIYMSDMEKYHASVKFQFKMIIVFILILNGFLMNFYVSPKLLKLQIEKISGFKEIFLMITGTTSIVSWFLTFTLGRIKFLPYSLSELLLAYSTFLLLSITLSYFLFRVKNSKLSN